ERLRRVHDLLVSAGPPPDDVPAAPAPPKARIIPFRPRVATVTRLAAAAAIAVAFGIGFLVGNSGRGVPARVPVSLHRVGPASAASALVRVGSKDAHGNWPLLFSVRNLPSLGKQGYYELYLWHKGKRGASCGTLSGGAALTTVHLNAPYYSDKFGWVL